MVRLVTRQPISSLSSQGHVVWAVLGKIGNKQLKPQELSQGSSHKVVLHVHGTVDGRHFEQSIDSVLTVGFEQKKTSSVNPQVPQLLALILSKLNTATRNRIPADIPTEFAANENVLPKPDDSLVNEVEQMLLKLRRQKTVQARGPIRCEFTLQA
jgi:hypothetical protein